jgi:hypothetical protein
VARKRKRLTGRQTTNVVFKVGCWSFLDGALGSYRIAAGEAA